MLAEWASARHRAAIRRADLSRPIRLGREDGIITEQTVVFDYGCGHGDDVKRLMALGIPASGWDPVHATHAVKRRSDVVNLGFVLNVIENPTERVAVIQEAWSLASGVLIVAVRTTADQRDPVVLMKNQSHCELRMSPLAGTQAKREKSGGGPARRSNIQQWGIRSKLSFQRGSQIRPQLQWFLCIRDAACENACT